MTAKTCTVHLRETPPENKEIGSQELGSISHRTVDAATTSQYAVPHLLRATVMACIRPANPWKPSHKTALQNHPGSPGIRYRPAVDGSCEAELAMPVYVNPSRRVLEMYGHGLRR